MLDYAAYILIKAVSKLFQLVPVSATLWLGRRIGSIAFFFNKKRRLIAYANLKAAFCAERSPAELRLITKRVYQNLVETVVEILNLTKVNKSYVDRYVEVVNMERIENAARSGRGVILLTGHFGDWELSSLVSAMKGFPILVLAREQKMKRVNELLNSLRESKGCKVVRKGVSTKTILRALHEREMVGILSDQDAGRNGIFVTFFGRPTSTHAGAMEMAKRADSIILPNFIVRQKGPRHKLYLEEYIDFRQNGGDDIRGNLQRYAGLLESYVRKYPDQWLWLHKRWKSTPARTVLVLNDGRAGHLNQSLAVAEEIRKARATQGYGPDNTRVVIVEVRYRNGFSRALLRSCALFAGWRCHGCMRCMKLCLEKKTYEALMRNYAEFIVSCGSGLSAVNVFMAKENNAKNIVIMKPGPKAYLKKFNLAIIPRHDRPPAGKNVLVTAAAPNLMDEETLKAAGGRLRQSAGIKKDRIVGLLLGGDSAEFSFGEELAAALADRVSRFCAASDSEFLATTSRRTSSEVSSVLKKRFGADPRCRLLVIANESNPEGTVGGILGLSDIVVVSGESISMISEAVSSGKPVIVFSLVKSRPGPAKHEAALKELEKEGYITVSRVEDLDSALHAALKAPGRTRRLEDSHNIFEAVRRLI